MNPRLLLRLRPSPRSRSLLQPYTSFHTTTHRSQPRQPPSSSSTRAFPTVEECPAPTCECAPAPELEIDRKSKLAGIFVPYVEQVLVCTGRDDWASRVEEDEGADGGGEVLRGFKRLFGRGGKFADVINSFLFQTPLQVTLKTNCAESQANHIVSMASLPALPQHLLPGLLIPLLPGPQSISLPPPVLHLHPLHRSLSDFPHAPLQIPPPSRNPPPNPRFPPRRIPCPSNARPFPGRHGPFRPR
jgi:hypothetical protein